MTTLRPMTDDEYLTWREAAIPSFAADKVAARQWADAAALDLARQAHADLLPNGLRTLDHHLYAVLNAQAQSVGVLWFAAQDQGAQRIAFLYDVFIAEANRRQGHGVGAMRALEREVVRLGLHGIALHVFGHNQAAHALYVKLGFAATNINMFKVVARDG